MSPLQETSKDPFSGDCSCRQDGLTVIITACLTFATGVTVALIMQIYFGDPQVRQSSGFAVGLWLRKWEKLPNFPPCQQFSGVSAGEPQQLSVRPWVLSLCISTPRCLKSFFLRLGVVLREASWALGACPAVGVWVAVPGRFGGAARGKWAAPLLCL